MKSLVRSGRWLRAESKFLQPRLMEQSQDFQCRTDNRATKVSPMSARRYRTVAGALQRLRRGDPCNRLRKCREGLADRPLRPARPDAHARPVRGRSRRQRVQDEGMRSPGCGARARRVRRLDRARVTSVAMPTSHAQAEPNDFLSVAPMRSTDPGPILGSSGIEVGDGVAR